MPYQPLLFTSNFCQVLLHAVNVNDSVVDDANTLYDVIHQTFICVHTLVQDAPLGRAEILHLMTTPRHGKRQHACQTAAEKFLLSAFTVWGLGEKAQAVSLQLLAAYEL
ncbi:hypothetical protein ElyMa_006140900 [Elysia marginata]|uniref:Uncharacterized protein n=1 Tax=Elysia marginata TaxID=1093978 RepID=A0AAV4GX09_9GAST|nr:hypothetical protein ElyMa_006140900 [Elysia marginata]